MRSIDPVALCVLVGLTVWNFRFGKKHILYPPFVFSFVWTVAYLAYLLFPMDIFELTSPTILLFMSGTICFSVGGVVARVMGRYRPRSQTSVAADLIRRTRSLPFYKLLLILSMALLPLFYLELRELGSIGGTDDLFKSARVGMAVLATEQNYTYSSPLMANAPTFSILVLFVFLFEFVHGNTSRLWLGIAFLNACLFAFLTTGRTAFLMITLGTIGVRAIRRERPPYKTILVGLFIFAILFVSLVFVFKRIDISRTFVQTVNTYTFGYLAGPLVALDEVVYAPWNFALGVNHTFSPLMRVVSPLLGIRYQTPPLLDSYVFIPFPFNTYSVYKFYFLDFGFSGTLVVLFLIGLIQSWLFRKARTGGPIYEFMFTVSLYALVTSIFDDSYFQWIYYSKVLLFAVLCYRIVPWIMQAWVPEPVKLRLARSRQMASAQLDT